MKRNFLMLFFVLIIFSLVGHPKINKDIINYNKKVKSKELSRASIPHGFDVYSYDLHINIDEEEEYISGWCTAAVIAEESLTSIEYELESLNITQVKVNDEVVSNYTYNDGVVSIPLDVDASEEFTTTVYYNGNPELSDDGYNIGMIFRNNAVFTVSDPNAARYWFPCYDHPWDKAIINFNVTCRDDWVAACNGLQGEVTDNGDGTKSYEWIGSNPMSTYLMVIHIGPYELLEQSFTKTNGETIPIQNFFTSNYASDAAVNFRELPEMMQCYTEAYGEYQFEKYGQTVVSMQTFGAMEHQTMTTMGSNFLNGNVNDRNYTVAHELSHHWFGDCLTPVEWKDVWLSEGFAVYSEAVWANYHDGWQSFLDYVQSRIQNYYVNWTGNTPHTIYDPAYLSYFTPPSYEKAASVLHMLRLELGDETYWQTIRSWYADNTNKCVNTEEFISHCEDISGRELDWFFDQWIYGSGLPTVKYLPLRNLETNEVCFYNEVTSNSATDFRLTVPFYLGSESDSLKATFTSADSYSDVVSVADVSGNIDVDPDKWNLYKSISELSLYMGTTYAGNECALINWAHYENEDDFAGYKVYQKLVQGGTWELIATLPLTDSTYLAENLVNGEEYQFYVSIYNDDNFETFPSNIESDSVVPEEHEHIGSILIVDDTIGRDDTNFAPTDMDVDNFYDNILVDYNYDKIVIDDGADINAIFGYELVIWHHDTLNRQSKLHVYENEIAQYMLSGGHLILSGYKVIQNMDQVFTSNFFGLSNYMFDNSFDMHEAYSSENPILHVRDLDIIPEEYGSNIGFITSFTGLDESLYQKNDIEGVSIAVKHDNTYILGFPLYFFEESEVRSFLESIVQPVENEEEDAPAIVEQIKIYPNPAKDVFCVKYPHKRGKNASYTIFNILGQKVRKGILNDNSTIDTKAAKLANGVYFLKLKTESGNRIKKFVVLK